jgi:hypothetical protein
MLEIATKDFGLFRAAMDKVDEVLQKAWFVINLQIRRS